MERTELPTIQLSNRRLREALFLSGFGLFMFGVLTCALVLTRSSNWTFDQGLAKIPSILLQLFWPYVLVFVVVAMRFVLSIEIDSKIRMHWLLRSVALSWEEVSSVSLEPVETPTISRVLVDLLPALVSSTQLPDPNTKRQTKPTRKVIFSLRNGCKIACDISWKNWLLLIEHASRHSIPTHNDQRLQATTANEIQDEQFHREMFACLPVDSVA